MARPAATARAAAALAAAVCLSAAPALAARIRPADDAEGDAQAAEEAPRAPGTCGAHGRGLGTVCIVSSNQPAGNYDTTDAAFEHLGRACLDASNTTDVIALALQDFPGGTIPASVKTGSGAFLLRHQLLSEGNGYGKLCYSRFNVGSLGGAASSGLLGAAIGARAFGWRGALPGAVMGAAAGAALGRLAGVAFGPRCGGVGILVYALEGTRVDFDLGDESSWRRVTAEEPSDSVTFTTRKGTMAARFRVHGRKLIIASTHGTEGVRGKRRGMSCPAHTRADRKEELAQRRLERLRVEDFRGGLRAIALLRGGNASGGAAALWAGDFNHRSVDPATGCAAFPAAAAEEAATGAAPELERLELGRDVLGEDPGRPGDLATFSGELRRASSDMAELLGPRCPTYKKGGGPGQEQFVCREGGEEMRYKPSHPPSWTDRIFLSKAPEWLSCGGLRRVSHASDHDAVLAACDIGCVAGGQ